MAPVNETDRGCRTLRWRMRRLRSPIAAPRSCRALMKA